MIMYNSMTKVTMIMYDSMTSMTRVTMIMYGSMTQVTMIMYDSIIRMTGHSDYLLPSWLEENVEEGKELVKGPVKAVSGHKITPNCFKTTYRSVLTFKEKKQSITHLFKTFSGLD